MMILANLAVAVAVAIAVIGSTSSPLPHSPITSSYSVDAYEYARLTDVSLEEAERRLSLQPQIAALGHALEVGEEATFAGLYIDHLPQYRIVVQFTRNGPTTVGDYAEAEPLEPILQVEEVSFSQAQLLADLERVRHQLGEGDYVLDVDTPLNRVVIEKLIDTDLDSLAAGDWIVPSSAIVKVVEDLPSPALSLYGGLAFSECTSGFTVYKGTNINNRAITTAGHCNNQQSYNGDSLTYQNDEVITGSHDAQSHRRSGATYPNRVHDGLGYPYYRTITSKRSRSNQSVGDFVCKYGRVTGYGCGYIVSKSSTPCGGGGGAFNTAIKVDSDPDGEGYDLSQGGDSGGPWFINQTALRTMSCQQGYDAIYVAINYVESGLGATIWTGQ